MEDVAKLAGRRIRREVTRNRMGGGRGPGAEACGRVVLRGALAFFGFLGLILLILMLLINSCGGSVFMKVVFVGAIVKVVRRIHTGGAVSGLTVLARSGAIILHRKGG